MRGRSRQAVEQQAAPKNLLTRRGITRKASLTVAACVALWAGTALAASTPQEKCDGARITAWRTYLSCIDTVVAKDAKGIFTSALSEFAPFAKCRHAYFSNWEKFWSKASLVGSTCIRSRFTDNGDGTVKDNLTALVWEKKTNLDSTESYADPHDADNVYIWGTGELGKENGTVFTDFLGTLNGGGGFAGSNGWRLPTVAELQTIVLDFACTGAGCSCPSSPCVDRALDASNTQSSTYWSATSYVSFWYGVWVVYFGNGGVSAGYKPVDHYVRAVRGGL